MLFQADLELAGPQAEVPFLPVVRSGVARHHDEHGG